MHAGSDLGENEVSVRPFVALASRTKAVAYRLRATLHNASVLSRLIYFRCRLICKIRRIGVVSTAKSAGNSCSAPRPGNTPQTARAAGLPSRQGAFLGGGQQDHEQPTPLLFI